MSGQGGETLEWWFRALVSARVTPTELARACRSLTGDPEPSDLIGWVLKERMDAETQRALEEAMRPSCPAEEPD